MQIAYCGVAGAGWGPIARLAQLAGEFFQAPVIEVTAGTAGKLWRETLSFLPRRRTSEPCLIIAPQPQLARAAVDLRSLLGRYGHVALWVVDSFWIERLPRLATSFVDSLYVTDAEYVDAYARRTGKPVRYLPWGADVLGVGPLPAHRPVDLQRLGRQPPEWEDDVEVRAALADAGLVYRGRPPLLDDPKANHAVVRQALLEAKFVLAFGNRVAPSAYTHPTHEYVTARWTDALAAGASVVGVPPECVAARELLWEEGLVRLEGIGRPDNVASIRSAVDTWTPELAVRNHRRALERLDWRHRLALIAEHLGIDAPQGARQLAEIRERVEALT